MKISLNHIRYYQRQYGWTPEDAAPEGVDALAHRIGAQLGAVEEVVPIGDRYEGVRIVKVVSCERHPNADRLHVCKIDDGGQVQNMERDDSGFVRVVCGAPNVHADMLAAWLPPGSTVPASANNEPFVLEAREIRGQKSNGMLASARELALGDNHEGILEIDDDVAPGTSFADHYELAGDYIIDIENKMFTHRPDCFGMLGVAREIAGIQHQQFTSPDWWQTDAPIPEAEQQTLSLEVENQLPDQVPRFVALPMSGVEVKPSPIWLQVNLSRLGVRPINNIVDLTNYNMLLTGQPLHAYDYDKVKAMDNGADHPKIVVRHPQPGEKLTLLGGKVIEPHQDAVLIATRDKPIGLGGIMGGADTEVDENTKNIILECANFDMYATRRAAMHHGLFTDAATRFTKGQSPLQNRAVVAKIVKDIEQLTGGKVTGALVDDNHVPAEVRGRASMHPKITVTPKFINERLGVGLEAREIRQLLKSVEFIFPTVGDESQDASLEILAPFWRTDVAIPEDVVEEVGRLYGYDRLPLELPARDLTPPPRNPLLDLKARVRDQLSAAGANEVLTYTFVHGNLLDKVGQDKNQAFQIANALSPDLQYYRLSLTPSLLEKVHPNIKAGQHQFALFELGKVHHNAFYEDDLPREFERIAFVFGAEPKTSVSNYAGAAYYQARKYLMLLLETFGVTNDVRWQPLSEAQFGDHAVMEQMTKPFDPNRSAVLVKGDLIVGVIGEYKSSVRRALKLPDFAAGFEVFHSFLQAGKGVGYTPLPRFPKVEQDICLKVSADMPYAGVYQFVWNKLAEVQPKNTLPSLGPVDIYQRPDDRDHKQITLRLSIASFERTLTDEEVNKLLDHVADAAKTEIHAERV